MTSESLELFGFWTYEFRVGHFKRWSTAQGRFGRPIRVTGIQHPAPHLICTTIRSSDGIEATAPYANTVYNGRRVYDFIGSDPQTHIWFMLYAQVLQADGATYRNVLLAHRRGVTIPNPPSKTAQNPLQSFNRDPRAGVRFIKGEVERSLTELCLPSNTPLSVLAVEVLPGPLNISYINDTIPGPKDGKSNATQPATEVGDAASTEDPVGANLGKRRILRASPLVAVKSIC
jgi:hypothetical protein